MHNCLGQRLGPKRHLCSRISRLMSRPLDSPKTFSQIGENRRSRTMFSPGPKKARLNNAKWEASNEGASIGNPDVLRRNVRHRSLASNRGWANRWTQNPTYIIHAGSIPATGTSYKNSMDAEEYEPRRFILFSDMADSPRFVYQFFRRKDVVHRAFH